MATEIDDQALGYVRVETWEGEPCAWWVETQTYGTGDGCSRPFWRREDAIAYARQHQGYVRPLFLVKALENSLWKPLTPKD